MNMKITKLLRGLAAALALLALCSNPAAAQQNPNAQYGYTTLHVEGTTNGIANAAATNIHVTALGTNGVTLTKWGDFTLNVDGFSAGALTNGMLDFRWSTSADGTSWNTNATLNASEGAGWFSLGVNTGGSRFIMNTNITVNSIGYWRIDFITNRTGLTVSNMTIRAYLKPRRTG